MERHGLGIMDEATYVRVIESAVRSLRLLSFGGIGDCFLHPDFHRYLDLLCQEIETQWTKERFDIFIYTKLQNVKVGDLEKIRQIQEKWFRLTLYVSIFSFRKSVFEMMTGLKFEKFLEAFRLVQSMKIHYKINFTLTKHNIDDLPILIKNFHNYQVETVHDFDWGIDRNDHVSENMRNMEFSVRPTNLPADLQFLSFCITYRGDFRLSDRDSKRTEYLWNIATHSFQEINRKLANLSA